MKRNLTRIGMIFLLVMLLATGVVFAGSEPMTLQFDKTTVSGGDLVSGAIVVNSEHVTNGMITITYDSQRMELVEAEKSKAQNDVYASVNGKTDGKIIVAFAGEEPVKTGNLIDLQFKIKTSVRGGDKIEIKANVSRIYDENNQAVKGADEQKQILVVAGGTGTGSGSVDHPGVDDPEQPGDDVEIPDDNPPTTSPDVDGDGNGNGSGNGNGKPSGTGTVQPGSSGQTGIGSEQNGQGNTIRTGDTQSLVLWILIIFCAGTALVMVIRKRRQVHHENK